MERPSAPPEGQLNSEERRLIQAALRGLDPLRIAIEVGTWKGGGSTLHILRILEEKSTGHLWGIEADRNIYDAMLANIRSAFPGAERFFTPLFGFSNAVIPAWIQGVDAGAAIDFVFLDGGDNPMEQIDEFRLLRDRIRVGGLVMSHDAKLRKGKWLRPYVRALDNWQVQLHDVSDEGLLEARKLRPQPSAKSAQEAERLLAKLRCAPIELLGRILPSSVCGAILNMLPTRLRHRISQGRT